MRCPKCGSNEGFVTERRPNGNTMCLNCYYSALTSDFADGKYQQRLERVLAKFKPETNKYHAQYTYYGLDWSLTIVYNGRNFLLSDSHGSKEIKISLETVESLLKDLKNNDH